MKWTQDCRRKLYSRLVEQIGSHHSWDAKIKPVTKRKQFDMLLTTLAHEFSQNTGETCTESAIQQQINFATTTESILKDKSLIRNFIMNKAAALEAEFISSSSLPNRITSEFNS